MSTMVNARTISLPVALEAYLHWAGGDGRRYITEVRQRQEGRLRTRMNGPWYPVQGALSLKPAVPERIWTGVIKPYPLVRVTGRDAYVNHAGTMLIEAYSRFTLAHVTGPEMDASALVTILAELPLAPSAMRPSDRLRWGPIDDRSAHATLRDGALSVSGIFTFAPSGAPIRFETDDRYRRVGKRTVRTPWLARYEQFANHDGWNVPVEMSAAWELTRYVRTTSTFLHYETQL
jgi:hypothetical protein